ncbi:MAG: hypothetical protein E4H36_10765 [Spirochaetales bacterium]|nr:MAG: hypothetical protein E4H36_10765 [Spirochaetales bacterium]
MENVVEEILQTEKNAEEILTEAGKKALELQSQADREIQEALTRAKLEAADLVRKRIGEAADKAALTRRGALEKAERESLAMTARNNDKLDSLVQEILQLISKPLYTS